MQEYQTFIFAVKALQFDAMIVKSTNRTKNRGQANKEEVHYTL
jgi:hypothetical protein